MMSLASFDSLDVICKFERDLSWSVTCTAAGRVQGGKNEDERPLIDAAGREMASSNWPERRKLFR
jgi:hypothetical protein